MSSTEELTNLINKKAEDIRNLKANKASKEVITANVEELLKLKEQFKEANGGVPFDPPKAEPPKKKTEESTNDGSAKKDNQAKKDSKKTASEKSVAETSSGSAPVVSIQSTSAIPSPITPSVIPEGLTITYSSSQVPEICRTVASILSVDVVFTVSPANTPEHQAFMTLSPGSGSISGDSNISRYFVRAFSSSTSPQLYGSSAWESSQVDQWLDLYSFLRASGDASPLLPLLEGALQTGTYLVGAGTTLADVALFLMVKRLALLVDPTPFPNCARWFSLISSALPHPKSLTAGAKKGAASTNKEGSSKKDNKKEASKGGGAATTDSSVPSGAVSGDLPKDEEEGEEGGTCPPLPGAVEGAVCTRFPPEPSGYLHIGHAKAVLLNQYYAQRYKGRLLVRFDDTNPSKEKEEFEENIIEDLKTLGIVADSVSHTSDHFELCERLGRQMIEEGKAYMDDTNQETMQAERMERTESARRNTPPSENMRIFESLLRGDEAARTYCLRAKIDMSSVNGTMRDPVLYRFNDTPHHRTGTKYKAYPTYDFACPVVDAIEGVTHALRTTEYNDRDEQYHWLQDAMRLRYVHIQSFGKMNFVHTVLSKRKLTWFVEQGWVDGWFDPRFPTIQGCVRRGMNVEALKSFIISQGASRRVITMEWDKFWSENKKILEAECARYMGVNVEDAIRVVLTNVAEEVTGHSVQIHPQKPEMGNRVMRRSNRLLLDQSDATLLKEGEEVTLLRWGNITPTLIEKDARGKVTNITATYNPDATNFSKTKKLTWLADIADLVPCQFVEFDHLISKAKLGDDEDFKDFVNPSTQKDTAGLADPCLRLLAPGTVIQIERKGFYRLDKSFGGEGRPAVLFAIPDGKQKPGAALAPVPAPKEEGKGKKKK